MTVRLSVSLPDDVHAQLVRLAEASNISAGAVVRSVLSDVLPRMTSVLEYLGSVKPADAPAEVRNLEAWSASLQALLHDAPESLGSFRTLLDQPSPGGDDE
jgi:predicted transcriptional regulator